MAAIATAFVSVRPDLRKFKSEADKGIQDAGLDKSGTKQGKTFGDLFSKSASGSIFAGLRQNLDKNVPAGKGLLGLAGSVTGVGDAASAASKESSLFSRVLSGVSLATGILEPALAGVIVVAGGLAAAFAAAGAGAAAYSIALKPLLSQTQDVIKAQGTLDKARATAQANYTTALKSGVSVKTADAARTKAMTAAQQQYNQAVKGTPAPVRAFAKSVEGAQKDYKAWADSLARPVLRPLSGALKLVQPVLKAISPLVKVTAGAFGFLVDQLSRNIAAGGLTSVVNTLLPHVRQTIIDLGLSVGNLVAGIFDILKAFLPVSSGITGRVLQLTELFKQWAASLPSHTGFQSLMSTFKQSTPLAVAVLKNLVVVIKNVATATTGLASPSNSKALLQILIPLTGIIGQLSKNQALVRFVLYALLLNSSLKKVSAGFSAVKLGLDGLKTGFGVVQNLAAGFNNASAAESAFTGFAGTIGGQLKSLWTWFSKTALATKIATAAQWLWNAALDANPIGIIIIAMAALGVAFAVLWTKSATFRTIMIKSWNAVWGVFKSVYNWIKANWPLLVGLLTGPIGIAVVLILKNWARIVNFFKALPGVVLHAVGNLLPLLVKAGKAVIQGFINGNLLTWKAAATWFSQTAHRVLTAVGNLINTLRQRGRDIMQGFWNGSREIYDKVIQWVRAIPGRIVSAIGTLNRILFNKGQSVIQGLYDGALSIWNKVTHWISSLAGWIKAHKGPLSLDRNLLKPAGVAIMNGLHIGLLGGFQPISGFLKGIAGGIGNFFGNLFGGGGGGSFGAGVQQWSGLVLNVLSMLGQSSKWLPVVLRRMNQESGGNPHAINLTDSNAQAGDPSRGLMQTIGSTFAAYAGPFLKRGIYDPLANIYAGLNYALHTYGTLAALSRPGGYAMGGIIKEKIFGVGASGKTYTFGERGPETVIPGVAGGGVSTSRSYNITVNVGPSANKAEVGKSVVDAIKAYERGNGIGWRS